MTRDEVVLIGEISKLFDEIERLQKLVPEWRSVNNPPEKKGGILIVCEDNLSDVMEAFYDPEHGWDERDGNGDKIAFWMPKPKGPEVGT